MKGFPVENILLSWTERMVRLVATTDDLYWSAFSYLSSTLSREEVCYLQLSVDRAIWSHHSQTGNPGGNISFTSHVQLTDPTEFVINMPFIPRSYDSRWIEVTPSQLLQNKALFAQTQRKGLKQTEDPYLSFHLSIWASVNSALSCYFHL